MPKPKPPVKKFKLLHGMHREGKRTYKQGETVTSRTDLTRFNSPGAIKFQPLGAANPLPSTPVEEDLSDDETDTDSAPETGPDEGSDLDRMTVAELRAFAEEAEIDLSDAVRKDEIIAAIRDAGY